MTVILEQGNPLQMIQLLQSPWEDRFRVSTSITPGTPGSCRRSGAADGQRGAEGGRGLRSGYKSVR